MDVVNKPKRCIMTPYMTNDKSRKHQNNKIKLIIYMIILIVVVTIITITEAIKTVTKTVIITII